jgi:hypothetical protein
VNTVVLAPAVAIEKWEVRYSHLFADDVRERHDNMDRKGDQDSSRRIDVTYRNAGTVRETPDHVPEIPAEKATISRKECREN